MEYLPGQPGLGSESLILLDRMHPAGHNDPPHPGFIELLIQSELACRYIPYPVRIRRDEGFGESGEPCTVPSHGSDQLTCLLDDCFPIHNGNDLL